MIYLNISHVFKYISILAYFKRFYIFHKKKLVFEKIFNNNFNVAENYIISVEATILEHIIKCETI